MALKIEAVSIRKTILLFVLSGLSLPAQVSRPVVDTVTTAATPAPTASLPEHKIVPNDLLSIIVYDEPDVSKPSIRVGTDGTIVIPYLAGRLKVQGLLPREVEDAVTDKLKEEQILVHPAVTVNILEYATKLISVIGDVRIPGQFNVTGPITLLDALAKAAWTTPEAGPDLLFSKSAEDAPRKINIAQLQSNTDSTVNVTLTGGEIINVPEAPKVWVMGNVTKPSAVPVKNPGDATVLKVVASVEGLTQYSNKTAYIFRANGSAKRLEIEVPLWAIMHRKADDVQMQVDDILLIPDDNGTKRRALLQTLQTLGGAASSASVVFGLEHR